MTDEDAKRAEEIKRLTAALKHDKLLRAVKAKVSCESYNAYCVRLARLMEAAGEKDDLSTMLRSAKRSNDILQKKYESVVTRRNVIDAVMSVYLHNPKLAKEQSTAYEAWARKQRVLRGLVQKGRENNRMTPELKAKYIDLKETRGVAEKLHKVILATGEPTGKLQKLSKYRLSQDYLLLLLMVDVPPKRADLGELRVVRGPQAAPKNGNYVSVPDKGQATLVLRDFKTAKKYTRIEDVLPDHVSEAIRESLSMFPRAYLFTSYTGDQPLSAGVYADMVKRVFKRHTGKPAGINALRHAYITQMADHGKVTLGELNAMAKSMGHSPAMQNQYQVVQ